MYACLNVYNFCRNIVLIKKQILYNPGISTIHSHHIEVPFLCSPKCFAPSKLRASYSNMINLWWCSEAGSNNPLPMTNRACHFGLSVGLLVFQMCGGGSFVASEIIICKVRDCHEKPQERDGSLSISPVPLSLPLTFHCDLCVYFIPLLWNVLVSNLPFQLSFSTWTLYDCVSPIDTTVFLFSPPYFPFSLWF